jgi:calcium-dependent protein kinase
LFDKIVSNGFMTERVAAGYFFDILSAISYCHAHSIVHRDIKPENLLFLSNKPNSPLKVIDFGTSRSFTKKERMKKRFGTPFYIAPEVLDGDYDEKCDVWSCGVILYILLSGRPPFMGESNQEIFDNIRKGEFSLTDQLWAHISNDAKDIIRRMLTLEPSKRPSIAECLSHKWIKNREEHSNTKVTSMSLTNI